MQEEKRRWIMMTVTEEMVWYGFMELRRCTIDIRIIQIESLFPSSTLFLWCHNTSLLFLSPNWLYFSTFIPTSLHTYLLTYLSTSLSTYLPTYLYSLIHSFINSFIHSICLSFLPSFLPSFLFFLTPFPFFLLQLSPNFRDSKKDKIQSTKHTLELI